MFAAKDALDEQQRFSASSHGRSGYRDWGECCERSAEGRTGLRLSQEPKTAKIFWGNGNK